MIRWSILRSDRMSNRPLRPASGALLLSDIGWYAVVNQRHDVYDLSLCRHAFTATRLARSTLSCSGKQFVSIQRHHQRPWSQGLNVVMRLTKAIVVHCCRLVAGPSQQRHILTLKLS